MLIIEADLFAALSPKVPHGYQQRRQPKSRTHCGGTRRRLRQIGVGLGHEHH